MDTGRPHPARTGTPGNQRQARAEPIPALQVAALFIAVASAVPGSAQSPKLVPAALRSVSPAGVTRGQTVTLTLDGVNVSGATAAVFDDAAITGTVSAGAGRNQAKVQAVIGPETQTGIRRVFLKTPLGTTGAVTFAVGAWPEVAEKEPNETPAQAPLAKLPATLTGALSRAGDADCFRFEVAAGQELVFEVVASQVRSRLSAVLHLLDADGRVLAESSSVERLPDALLGHRFKDAGVYAIRVRDYENAAGGDVTYRVNATSEAYATGAFPLGVSRSGGEVTLEGFNLGGGVVRIPAGSEGSFLLEKAASGPLLNPVRLAVGEEPEVLEREAPNDEPAAGRQLEWPVTVNGRISAPGKPDTDCYRFRARKGDPVILEVNARRLGSPLDSVLEVLDASGKRVERATLRPVAETAVTLNDRDSASAGIRLLAWNDFAVNDFVYVRGEVIRIAGLPRGPDDDVRFRAVRGQRAGFLETTPAGIAMNAPVYKVQVHPPGSRFPPNGMPLFRLYYRNDDGGPLYGKDSLLTFTPPADGEYVVRVTDVRGEASERHAYRLTLRRPRPDFRLTLGAEYPNVPAGASVPVEVTADRLDGFAGEIAVRLEGLPPGISATSAVIEAGELSATLLLTAAADAGSGNATGPLRLVGQGRLGAEEQVRTFEPAGGKAWVTVLPRPDLTVRTVERKITIRPGEEQHVQAAITRENGFAGRVPIDLKNLPFGVRILDVGLNGVLITESETDRRFTIFCEPWVRPGTRLIYCTVRTETESSAPTEVAAEPILLEILAPR